MVVIEFCAKGYRQANPQITEKTQQISRINSTLYGCVYMIGTWLVEETDSFFCNPNHHLLSLEPIISMVPLGDLNFTRDQVGAWININFMLFREISQGMQSQCECFSEKLIIVRLFFG